MTTDSVGFIGGGNMTLAIARGMLKAGFEATAIVIAEPNESQQSVLREALPGVSVSADNDAVVAHCDCIVLAVKPQILPSVCRAMAGAVQASRPLLISIAAGPRSSDIDRWLGGENPIVRVMPNQPALIGLGISGVFGNRETTPEQMSAAKRILSAIGPVLVVDKESDIDVVTAVSGSGPAYFYLLIEMLAKSGVSLGLAEEAAQQLALETALGASTLARQSGESMGTLISRVRSPGGTTAAALDTLDNAGVQEIFSAAINAARDRAVELADQAHDSAQE